VPFDHTTIIATVRKRFGISGALTARDAQAPDLDSVLTLPRPTNLGPLRLKALPYAPTPATAAVTQTKPLNSMQKALVGLATNLSPAPGSNLQADSPSESESDTTSAGAGDRIGQRARRPGLRETAGGKLFPRPLKNDFGKSD